MKIKRINGFTFLLLFLLLFSIFNQNNIKNSTNSTEEDLKNGFTSLKQAGFWNNFTFIHITDLNWTIANETDWCSGSGTWGDPYVIENMTINATDSPIGFGILIENSILAYFKIINVTVFGTNDGIILENTNNGVIINSNLSTNIASGITLINCANNTISRNIFINNGAQGINLTSNCINNKILGNTAKNVGTNFQDSGIYLGNYCDDNIIGENIVYDNNVNGILLEDYCQGNLIYNNTIKNTITNQQDYGISLDYNCDQNNISLNKIEDINSYGIRLVTSDKNYVTNNQIINCNNGFYMLIALQNKLISNTISGGSLGILMSACDGGEIFGNFINNTGGYAIRLFINCDDNEFHDNIIKDNNNLGIQLNDPSDINNKFYRNSFISNGIHTIDNGTSSFWNNSMIGNYWDNYTGVDLNNDNIGDTPYSILGATNANDSLPIVDYWAYIFTVNAPASNQYGFNAPEFNLFVNEIYIDSMWYTINNSGIRYYFTENSTINQDAWDALSDGSLIISFYFQDFSWDIGSQSIVIWKDTSKPEIIIFSPAPGQSFGISTPEFTIFVDEVYIDSMWYTINNNGINYYFTENGTIDQDVWDALSDGSVNITFYTRDIAWNIGSNSVIFIKNTSQSTNNGPSTLDLISIIIISIITVSAVVIFGIILRRRSLPSKEKLKKSQILTEEQLSKIQYFKDVTNILIVLAIHKDSGLCLSKIALHGGIGLDENLFTGFISAIGSFKNELAKQMGLGVRGEGGDNVIEYNEFTITLMDGEYLRLGLVSYNSLGKVIKEKCGQVLRAYELKHVNDLKNFDGELQIFKDFEEIIETGFDMNLNRKSIINVKLLIKYDIPQSFKTILNDLKSKP
ncbi:MAG: nitrous oxide reductase family maturation protein NosD, partial [Candidatus Thorarchaeota archaeon]